tara:strand:- start:3390 stop:4412 length:1023 start_codon:yes stop_codon:yes gene_type:complete
MKNSLKIFDNKRIIITGGTGSFGSMFLSKISNSKFKEILVISRDEDKQFILRNKYSNPKIKFIVGDIRDKDILNRFFKNIDIVIHAAALKQVPSCEYHPDEALKTNIIGSSNVFDAAIDCNVKRVVFLSTDKAVYPINSMGISKSMAEKILISKSLNQDNNKTIFNIIRYGNVIASRGSVVRTFINQILNNESLTITDNNMTRFIMSLDNALELLCSALSYGKSGEIFVQKTFSIKLITLAKALNYIFGKKNKIKNIGIRHGEKLHEILISEEESLKTLQKRNFYIIKPDSRTLNYDIYFKKGKLNTKKFLYSSSNNNHLSTKALVKVLLKDNYIRQFIK